MNLSHLIASYGYWVLFLLVAAESLGVPLPGETALIIAGTYAGHTHKLSPWVICAVASAAAIIGDNIGYWLGDQGGYRLARRYGPKVRLDERKLKTARYLFDRHGVLGGVLRPVRVGAACVRRVPGRREQDALADIPARQRRGRHPLGRDLHARRRTWPAMPCNGPTRRSTGFWAARPSSRSSR